MSLPFELYRNVLSCFNTNDFQDRCTLVSLSVASKAINVEAERVLYRRFIGFMLVLTNVKFLRSAILHNRASIVETYSCNPVTFDGQCTNELEDMLPKALKTFVNLNALEVRWMGPTASFISEDYPFQLDSFAWCLRDETSASAKFVAQFLRKQTRLKHILYADSPFPEPLSELPLLETVIASWGNIQGFLLAGANVKAVVWIPPTSFSFSSPPTVSQAEALASSLKQITILDIHASNFPFWVELVFPVFPYLSNLQSLHLVDADISAIDTLLENLPNVSQLCLSVPSSESFDDMLQNSEHYFANSPSLRMIQWAKNEHPSTAETILKTVQHHRDGTSCKEIALDPFMTGVSDSIFSLTRAVTIAV
jgi:hypothetical protein